MYTIYIASSFNSCPLVFLRSRESISKIDKIHIYTYIYILFVCYKKCHSSMLITGDGIWGRPRGVVIVTTFLPGDHNSRMLLRRRYCRFGGDFYAGFTGGCLLDNLQCVRWWKSRRDDVLVSVNNHWWITTELLMKSYIHWCLKRYPLLWSCCDVYLFAFHFKKFSYKQSSWEF